jgi:hypothetical protein
MPIRSAGPAARKAGAWHEIDLPIDLRAGLQGQVLMQIRKLG